MSLLAKSAKTLPSASTNRLEGGRVVRLDHVDEVLAVGGDVDGVIERRIGEPFVALAVQADAVQLQLHVIVATAGHVIKQAGLFIDLDDVGDFKGMVGQRGQ